MSTRIRRNLKDKVIWIIGCGHAGDFTHGQMAVAHVACARLSDSIRSGNVLKAKLRRARLGKGGGGGGKNGRESLLAFL